MSNTRYTDKDNDILVKAVHYKVYVAGTYVYMNIYFRWGTIELIVESPGDLYNTREWNSMKSLLSCRDYDNLVLFLECM